MEFEKQEWIEKEQEQGISSEGAEDQFDTATDLPDDWATLREENTPLPNEEEGMDGTEQAKNPSGSLERKKRNHQPSPSVKMENCLGKSGRTPAYPMSFSQQRRMTKKPSLRTKNYQKKPLRNQALSRRTQNRGS